MAERFEDLRVWQTARTLTDQIYALTKREPFEADWALKDQIRRSAISVMSNIAPQEYFLPPVGAQKGSRAELRHNLSISSVPQRPPLGKCVHNFILHAIKATSVRKSSNLCSIWPIRHHDNSIV
jgi:hypothetical protein